MISKTISHYKIIEKFPPVAGQVGEGGLVVSKLNLFKREKI